MFDIVFDGGGEGWQLVDPRPIKAMAPYTFFTPSEAELAALQPGDVVQLGVTPVGLTDGAAERIWLRLTEQMQTAWRGVVETGEVPGMGPGAELDVQPWHVLAVQECRVDDLEEEARYLARACVDTRILEGYVGIAMLERREPQAVAGPWPDTGWVFLGPGEVPALHVGPIGLVLNIDDSMMPLLRAPVGVRIERFSEGWRRARA
ncbi:hypothetical protein [Sagittula salina]|uniref:Uncharacterized protein n=1 Tax=Sagittula salina TaxID=2820268 RepID=A0A940MQ58_9RHOB|nr:hypothetical protein [Sagittula salina]MBP0481034.1 hypothetical protein [Sagittula salina]